MPTQTIITDTQVRIEFTPSVLNEPLRKVAGILGFEMMEWMYWNKGEVFLPDWKPFKVVHSRWDIEQLANLVGMGFVQTTRIGDGFVLTPDGHYQIARYLKHELDEHRFWEHQRRING